MTNLSKSPVPRVNSNGPRRKPWRTPADECIIDVSIPQDLITKVLLLK